MYTKDLLTGERFRPKRRNQKFETSNNRIMYNNNKAHQIRTDKENIDKPLSQNYKILTELIKPNEVKTYSKEFLSGKGYNFSVFTHHDNYKGKICFSIYSFILIDIQDNKPSISIYRKP